MVPGMASFLRNVPQIQVEDSGYQIEDLPFFNQSLATESYHLVLVGSQQQSLAIGIDQELSD